MQDIPSSTTLHGLTPELYERLTGRERRLAEHYFAAYVRSIERSQPEYFSNNFRPAVKRDLRWAARAGYLQGVRVPMFVAHVLGLVGGSLISGPLYGEFQQLLAPAIVVLLACAAFANFGLYRSIQINRYFKAHPEVATPDETLSPRWG